MNTSLRGIIASILLAVALSVSTASIGHAQTYNGPGIAGGVSAAGSIAGVAQTDIRTIIINTTQIVLSFLALVSVVVIVIAGIYLITSVGNDEGKEKAKKAILYAVVGLIVILLSEALIAIFLTFDNGSVLGQTGGVVGNNDIRGTVVSILKTVLSYMALIAVVMICIAGIYLVTSLGNEEAKEKAKKIIGYTIAGLIVILLASGIVWIFANAGD